MIKSIPKEMFEHSFLATEKFKRYVGTGLIMYFDRPHHPLLKRVLDEYETSKEINYISDGDCMSFNLQEYGEYEFEDKNQLVNDVMIYSSEYFCPIDLKTGEKEITENTCSIHWYNQSWKNKKGE